MYTPLIINNIIWKEVPFEKTDNLDMEKALNEQINLSKYGAGLQGFAFIYILANSQQTIQKESQKYRPRKKEVWIYQRIPYEYLMDHSSMDIHKMMANVYIQSIDTFPQLGVRDFDHTSFKKDVINLFEQKNWL